MAYDATATISEFLDATAAKQPAPGGGSVTALCGALAAAIGEMVLNYSVGKKGLEAHQDELRTVLAEMHRARQMMVSLMVDDQSAYQALTAARKLPRDSEQYRSEYPAALIASIRTPEAIAVTAAAILDLSEQLVDRVNYHLLSDLAVCAELAMATVRCGIYNVRVNLSEITDPADRRHMEETLEHIQSRALTVIQRVIPRIWDRNRQGP
jgi:formiminotetrahydrofolate cyclodeaminase